MPQDSAAQSRIGLICGAGAYSLWGFLPLYFRKLEGTPPDQILAHRILWSFVFLALLITFQRRWKVVIGTLASPKLMLILSLTTLLIAANWLTFLYAVSSKQVMQSSLGYFMNPLVNVLLGMIFLGERLRLLQILGVVLAVAGVLVLLVNGDQVPWIALTLALTFAFYGLLRKTVGIDGLLALLIETILLLPIAAGYVIYLQLQPSPVFGSDMRTTGLLMLSGIITAVPLLMFGAAARRLSLSTLGVLQYLAPSLQFMCAVVYFGEPFLRDRQISFACIWTAVALYTIDSLLAYRRQVAVEPFD